MLQVSANESGLGLTAWWLESQAQEEGAEDDENQLPNEEQEEDLTHLDTSADGDGVGLKSESSGTIKP